MRIIILVRRHVYIGWFDRSIETIFVSKWHFRFNILSWLPELEVSREYNRMFLHRMCCDFISIIFDNEVFQTFSASRWVVYFVTFNSLICYDLTNLAIGKDGGCLADGNCGQLLLKTFWQNFVSIQSTESSFCYVIIGLYNGVAPTMWKVIIQINDDPLFYAHRRQ